MEKPVICFTNNFCAKKADEQANPIQLRVIFNDRNDLKQKAEGKEKEFPTLGIALKTHKGENL